MPSTDATATRADDAALINAAPVFRVNGTEWPDLGAAVLSSHVSLPLHGAAHGEIRVMNWGTGAAEGEFPFADISLGDEISILPGESAQEPVFTGEVTAIEETYGDGTPQLTLLVQDKLHQLARRRNSRRFADMDVDAVISEVASATGLQAESDVGGARATYLQHNESDLAFLMRLTATYGVGLRMKDGSLRAKREEPDGSPFLLNLQDGTVKRARLMADLNHQPLGVTVSGTDLASDETPSHETNAISPAPDGRSASDYLSALGWEGASRIPHPAPRSTTEAEGLAKAQYVRMAGRFVRGTLVCSGAPPLRPGREVELTGVAERFQGTYRVVDCVHRFDQSAGYMTDIQVQRAGLS